jgi:hypothetical protein
VAVGVARLIASQALIRLRRRRSSVVVLAAAATTPADSVAATYDECRSSGGTFCSFPAAFCRGLGRTGEVDRLGLALAGCLGEPTLSSTVIYTNPWLSVREDRIECPDGSQVATP